MHSQIKEVIQTMLFTPYKVSIRLSAAELSPLGNLVSRMYYRSRVLELLNRNERFGFPHNGGQHTLELHCAPADAVAALESMREACLDSLALTEEERQVANEFSYICQEILAKRGSKQM